MRLIRCNDFGRVKYRNHLKYAGRLIGAIITRRYAMAVADRSGYLDPISVNYSNFIKLNMTERASYLNVF
jgi:hypothetical protein